MNESGYGSLTTPAQNTMNSATDLIEIFSSIQGEGVLAGYRQIFIRYPGCNLSCEYCDTILDAPPSCKIETTPGSGYFREIPQPVSLKTVTETVHSWCKQLPDAHHSISITGGEPMLHAHLLKHWLPELNLLLPLHLETNGTLPELLPILIEHLDFIAMDIKLPSSASTPVLWDKHRRFIEIAIERNLSVKVVVSNKTTKGDLLTACKLVSEIDDEIPFIIQPVTTKDGKLAIKSELLMQFQAIAASRLSEVRVIPQIHHILGVA